MPEAEYVWLPRKDLLTFEEIDKLVDTFADLGVDKVRLTGGEPLLRKDIVTLVRLVAHNPRIQDLAMTTNGVHLAEHAKALLEAGLGRVTVSLDTLRPDRFKTLARRDSLDKVLSGLDAARNVGFQGSKIDSVVIRGVNDDELFELIEFGKRVGAEVRFIEYMDVGGATQWSMDKVVSRVDILKALGKRYGPIDPVVETSSAPAERYSLSDGTVFGIISSTTNPFCRSCDRSRLTADGQWYLCLYAQSGLDLRKPLREGASKEELKSLIRAGWTDRQDRGAEVRLGLDSRDPLVEPEGLRKNPHLEMHTRGG
jgi:cyclic pyranopterin phosphate synthase